MSEVRQSAVRDVIGLPAQDALLLSEHDREFYSDDRSSGSSDEEAEGEHVHESSQPSPIATPAIESDAEENLDEQPSDTGESHQPSGVGEPAAKRKPPQPVSSIADVQARVEKGCKCGGEKNCFSLVPPEHLLSARRMAESTDRDHLYSFVAGKLDVLARRGATTHGHVEGQTRARVTYQYKVCEIVVCRCVFMYANDCSKRTLQRIQSHLDAGCVISPEHASTGIARANVLDPAEVDMAAQFVRNFAEVNGLPQPAAPRGHNGPAPTYLPCSYTKKMIHGLYMNAGGVMSYVSFTRVWAGRCKNVVILKPKEDVCSTCSELQSRILRAVCDEDRISSTEALQRHITKAVDARDVYRECIARAKLAEAEAEDDEAVDYCHLTFDFAQQATVPHHARQVGPLYFRVPRRIQIFGVANEGIPLQHNYLVDEQQTIGKDGSKCHGPNAVISMLHHHLEHHARKSSTLGLHADNCCGQNKNRSVMAYLAWRVIVGLNKCIELDFMRVGHTRCFVDAGFGLLKQKYRKNDVDTVAQLKETIESSASINKAELFC